MSESLEDFLGDFVGEKMPQYDPRYAKRVEGPTPNGGVYSIGFYYDCEGHPCVPEQASTIHIHEYGENGQFLMETVGFCSKAKN